MKVYKNRNYIEKSNDFEKMVKLVTQLNSMHRCTWSVGRIYAWKYGRWSERSQDDVEFEKQAELFINEDDNLCGIVITENFGYEYYLISEKNEKIIQNMISYLEDKGKLNSESVIIVSEDDEIQINTLIKNNFTFESNSYVTFYYLADKIKLPNRTLPDGYTLSNQRDFSDLASVEKQRFFSFNPDSWYDEIIDRAYKYCRKNPLLIPELNIVLLDNNNNPISSCMGYWDKKNSLMEIEVVATKFEYQNRGFAKIVISECIRKGLDLGVLEFSISAWEEKTRRLYSSFGEPVAVKNMRYKK